MASSYRLIEQIVDTEHVAVATEKNEGGSRYLSLVKTHLELARFYAGERLKEQTRASA